VYQSKYPDRWEKIVTMMGKEGIPVFPYYEYCGSKGAKGLGNEKRALPLSGKSNYTHVSWVEKANADLTDPDTLEDFSKMLDCTILKLKDKASFVGAWIRTRPSELPMSFSAATLARFSKDANGGKTVTREEVAADASLKNRYYAWWYGKRRDFLLALRERLVKGGLPNATVLFTAYPGEPVPENGSGNVIVQGDISPWKNAVGGTGKPREVRSLEDFMKNEEYLKTILDFPSTWADWEWNHAAPPADPEEPPQPPAKSTTPATTATSTGRASLRPIPSPTSAIAPNATPEQRQHTSPAK